MEYGYFNADCMDIMRELPDKSIDLAIVDPPYGDGGGTWKAHDKGRFGGRFDRYKYQEQAEHGPQNTAKKS